MMDFVGPVRSTFKPYLVLVRVVAPSRHIEDFRVTASTELLLPFVFFFVLLVPFYEFWFFRIFIFPVQSVDQYFVL
jgi:hypothetical protein